LELVTQVFRHRPASGIVPAKVTREEVAGTPEVAMERAQERPPDVIGAAERLLRPHARFRLGAKRTFDLALALVLLVALVPLILLVTVLLLGRGGWLERRERLGRDGRALRLWRFRPLPGGVGRGLERAGVRELPLLLSVIGGGLSFVGPRALAPEEREFGSRRLMAPGLIGPAQLWATDPTTASELDDAYVEEWSLRGDLRLLTSSRRRPPVAVRR
jgi:lipopolysaccharide/colanic/teichoic acid biosynthesis glycosyltransferase